MQPSEVANLTWPEYLELYLAALEASLQADDSSAAYSDQPQAQRADSADDLVFALMAMTGRAK